MTDKSPPAPNSRVETDTPALDPAAAQDQNPLTGQPDDAGKPDPKAAKWSPPKVDKKTGLTMLGGYPLSGPARAMALAADGKTEDPDGIVSPETIKAYKEA